MILFFYRRVIIEDVKNSEINKAMKKYSKTYTKRFVNTMNKVYTRITEEVIDTPFYISYFNILKRTAEVIDSLNIKDPISISIIFEYLLWNGYLSKDHKLNYCASDRTNNLGLLGADIITGKSVCLNNSIMLTDLLKQIGIKAYAFGAYVPPYNGKFESVTDIERNKIKSNLNYEIKFKLLSLLLSKKMGSHAITIIEDKGKFIINDPTNLTFLNISNFLCAKYIEDDLEVRLKPWMCLLTGDINKEELDRIVNESYLYHGVNPLTFEYVKSVSDEVLKLCEKSHVTLENFYEKNIKDIEIVCKTLKK